MGSKQKINVFIKTSPNEAIAFIQMPQIGGVSEALASSPSSSISGQTTRIRNDVPRDEILD